MKQTILAAGMVAVLPAAVQATDIAGDGSTNASLPISATWTDVTLEKEGDVDWYRVSLEAGQLYAFAASEFLVATLRGVDGKPLRIFWRNDAISGVSYKPTVSGTYYLQVTTDPDPDTNLGGFPFAGRVRATKDCAAKPATACVIKPGTTTKWLFTYTDDADWLKISLTKGKTYEFRYTGDDAIHFELLNAHARHVAGSASAAVQSGATITYRAPAGGVYYLKLDSYPDHGPTVAYMVSVSGG